MRIIYFLHKVPNVSYTLVLAREDDWFFVAFFVHGPGK